MSSEEPEGAGRRSRVRAIVVADMLFASRVRGVAAASGVEVRVVAGGAAAVGALRETGAGLMLVDVELAGGRGIETIRLVRSEEATAGVTVIGFGSHVNARALQEGRDAGADRVLARSGFVRALPALLGGAGVARDTDPE